MSDVFKAIADPTRRDILVMISKQPESVNFIAQKFNMSRPAVSKHIKVLTESKLIKVETDTHDGRQRNCIIQLEALQEIQSYLLKLEEFWQSNIQGLENYLAKKKSSKLT